MLVGFVIGVLVLFFLVLGWYGVVLVVIFFNCLLDGLDGVLVWWCGFMDVGGFFDIVLDFFFYVLVLFGFILVDLLNNVLVGGWLLFVFIGIGSSFFVFVVLVVRYQIVNFGYVYKLLYYFGGLMEGMEIILLFVFGCLFLVYFVWLVWLFGVLCWLMMVMCICSGYQILKWVMIIV